MNKKDVTIEHWDLENNSIVESFTVSGYEFDYSYAHIVDDPWKDSDGAVKWNEYRVKKDI